MTLLPLPPRPPELDPVENIWQFLRDNWLSNRVFESYEDVLDHCRFASNQLTQQTWKIMAIGLCNWAHLGSISGSGITRLQDVRLAPFPAAKPARAEFLGEACPPRERTPLPDRFT